MNRRKGPPAEDKVSRYTTEETRKIHLERTRKYAREKGNARKAERKRAWAKTRGIDAGKASQ